MARASNCMSNRDYQKVIRANRVSVLQDDLSITLDAFMQKHRALLVDLSERTRRVSKASLASALLAEDSSQDHAECRQFASRVVDAFSAARAASKSMTSGKKTGPGLKALVEALRQGSSSTPPCTSSQPATSSSARPLPIASGVTAVPKRLSKADAAKALGMSGQIASSPVKASQTFSIYSSEAAESGAETPVKTEDQKSNDQEIPCVASATYWVDSFQNTLCRKFPGQGVQVATMSIGENGFGIANFEALGGAPGESRQTEIPNLMIAAVKSDKKNLPKKRPAAAMKKPAASSDVPPPVASGSSSEGEAAIDNMEPGSAVANQPNVEQNYTVMFYKASGAYAVRETRLGKRQLFQISSKKKSKSQLLKIITQAKQKLLAGEDSQSVKDWAKSEAAN